MKSFGLLIFLAHIALTSIHLVGALPDIPPVPYRLDYEDDGLVKRSRPLRYTSPEYDDPEEPAEASKKRFSSTAEENAKRAIGSV